MTPRHVHVGAICVNAGNLHMDMEEQRDQTLLAILQQLEGKSMDISRKVCTSCEKMTVELNKVGISMWPS